MREINIPSVIHNLEVIGSKPIPAIFSFLCEILFARFCA